MKSDAIMLKENSCLNELAHNVSVELICLRSYDSGVAKHFNIRMLQEWIICAASGKTIAHADTFKREQNITLMWCECADVDSYFRGESI
jgi:hypothetical protein